MPMTAAVLHLASLRKRTV